VRLETERQGRFLARRVLFKLGEAGTEKCRGSQTRHRQQAGALRCALVKLLQRGSREALSGFACVLTDALGTRRYCSPSELAQLYERMECEGRFRQWRNDSGDRTGDNVPEQTEASNGSLYPAKGSAPSPSP
jgi:hypothetical protein